MLKNEVEITIKNMFTFSDIPKIKRALAIAEREDWLIDMLKEYHPKYYDADNHNVKSFSLASDLGFNFRAK